MKLLFLVILIVSPLINVSCKLTNNAPKDANGGIPCATCTTIIGVVEQLALVYNTTIDAALYKFCNILPNGLFRTTCHQAADLFAPVIIEGFYLKETPDVICHAMKFCRTDPGQPECRLFPKPNVLTLTF
jgi:acyloxyacyl hydrolase